MFSGKKTEDVPDIEFFTIFDTKTGAYREPAPAINKLDMMRNLENLFHNPSQQNNQLVTNSEDFQLFSVGKYWIRTGTLEGHKPVHVVNLNELKALALRNRPDVGIGPT